MMKGKKRKIEKGFLKGCKTVNKKSLTVKKVKKAIGQEDKGTRGSKSSKGSKGQKVKRFGQGQGFGQGFG